MAISVLCNSPMMRDMLSAVCETNGFSVRNTKRNLDEFEYETGDTVLVHTSECCTSTIQAVERLLRHPSEVRIIVLCSHACHQEILQKLGARVDAIIPEDLNADALISTIRMVSYGYKVVPDGVNGQDMPQQPLQNQAVSERIQSQEVVDSLSKREVAILARLQEGYSNKDIANQLDICETTVKVHLRSIYLKIGVSNRTKAAVWSLANLT